MNMILDEIEMATIVAALEFTEKENPELNLSCIVKKINYVRSMTSGCNYELNPVEEKK